MTDLDVWEFCVYTIIHVGESGYLMLLADSQMAPKVPNPGGTHPV